MTDVIRGETAHLVAWLGSRGIEARRLVPLAGDVSPRRYHRVVLASSDSAILAWYPPEARGACSRFVASTALLRSVEVRVPEILAADCEQGFMLLEDLGERTLYDLAGRSWDGLHPFFESALHIQQRVADLPPDAVADLNPPLDEELLRGELKQTWEIFLSPRGLTGDPVFSRQLESALTDLCRRLTEPPLRPCHRDFMARNLVPVKSSLAVLDHQDLRLGPVGYDLASLLNDSLFPPPALEERLLSAARLPTRGRSAYHRAAVQRALKAIGTFETFSRRGIDRHLPLIAPSLASALRHLEALPETAFLVPGLSRLWGPLIAEG